MKFRLIPVLGAVLACLAFLTHSVSMFVPPACAQTVTASDPVGDFQPGLPDPPPYLDIVKAQVSKKGDRFELRTEVAAPVPEDPLSPLLPAGVKQVVWDWELNTDPTTAPTGFPFPPGFAEGAEFIAFIIWDGLKFAAFLVDRRPLLTGGEAVVTPIRFSITGKELEVVVEAAALDNPSTFRSSAFTLGLVGPIGSAGVLLVDGVRIGTWP